MTLPEAIGFALIGAGLSAVWVLLFAGLARIPWRYAMQIAFGVTLVLAAGDLATKEYGRAVDRGSLVLAAALGAGVAVRAYERGKARRDAMIQAILDAR